MKGSIYIARAFETVNRSVCGQKGDWVDNDPHVWTSPPTRGICRNDFRAKAEVGDVIFFVLPRHGKHPQMSLGFLTIAEKISHIAAYTRADLRGKRMSNKMPNGNIIIETRAEYNRFDGGAHRHKFETIKRHYVIGSKSESRMLTPEDIKRRAPKFLAKLGSIIGIQGPRAIDIILRKGRLLTAEQVKSLLRRLNSPMPR